MNTFSTFITKRSLYISLVLLVLFLAMLFIPYVSPNEYWVGYEQFENSAFKILNNLCSLVSDSNNIPDESLSEYQLYLFAILFVYLVLWVNQIIAILLAKKHPFYFLSSLIPLSVIFFGTIYMVSGWAKSDVPPSAGVFIMAIIYACLLFIAFIWFYTAWLKPRLANRSPREHKPTKSERIAELERQVAELQAKEKDAE